MIYFVAEFSVVDIRLLPRDRRGEVIYPNIPKEKGIFALLSSSSLPLISPINFEGTVVTNY